jgi:hypothetical protein
VLRFNTPILELTNLSLNSHAGLHSQLATARSHSREAGSFPDPERTLRTIN